ncbi:gamma-glutamylcyclotransferase-like [Anneissia japonica]|uniref:gamma-glutamylcyclotransferase-like n=1 Tax=Anneissia japonica TaxID=1529436 RepID=UPI0014259ACE|nr:gamma-glutamylcyclotransferase-like [Anneissia japonica]
MESGEHPEAEGPVFELQVSESDEASEKSMQQKSYEEDFRPFRKGFFLYFSYGSNLLRERLLLKNPSATFLTIAKLEDYKLVFGQQRAWKSSAWKGGVATIEHSPGDHVWGVVWKLNRRHLQTLDLQESNYDGIEVNTKVNTGEILTCRTYVMQDMCSHVPPHPNYLDVIIRGAVQNQLPPEYITFLKSIEDNGSKETTEIYLEVMNLSLIHI